MRSLLLAVLSAGAPVWAQVESLPPPVVHGNSFEIVSNSRYSVRSGFTSSLPVEVLSNVLWATSRAPSLGSSFRELYVATPENVYLYDPAGHTMSVHLAGNHRYSSSSAFEVGIAVERDEEAGLAIQAGLLAGVAFWSPGGGNAASCPMAFAANHANSNWDPLHTIRMVNVYGQRTVTGLTDSCVARSSDTTLPLPATDRDDTFELLVTDLHQDSLFNPLALSAQDVSQLLWAGYGVTPHNASGGRRGTTIPSAVANYYLTRRIYLATDTAVMRYHNRRPPGTSLTTSDHRLELVTSGDRRDLLRNACPQLPTTAPAYIVLSVTDTSNAWHTIEAGFAAYQYLMQANALLLAGHLTAPLSPAERSAIQTALGLPAADHPVIVFSAGYLRTGVQEQTADARPWVKVRNFLGPPFRIEYSLGPTIAGRVTIQQLAGRQVREFFLAPQVSGPGSFSWDGKDDSGRRVPAGVYLCRLTAGDRTTGARVVLVW